jgi:cell division septal protein FtsQ
MENKQPKQSSKPLLKSKFPIYISYALIVGIIISLFILYDAFTVREIEVHAGNNAKQIFGLEYWKNQNILFQPTEYIEQHILKQNPHVKKVSVEKVYPSKIRVTIVYEYPVAQIQINSGFLKVNQEGKILEKIRTADEKLPQVKYYQQLMYESFQTGQTISFKDIQYALYFLQKVQSQGIRVNSIDIAGFHMLGLYSEEKSFIFSVEKDKDAQTYQFESVYRNFKIKGKDFKSIDVRFDKTIVTM